MRSHSGNNNGDGDSSITGKHQVRADEFRAVLLGSDYELAAALTARSVVGSAAWQAALEPLLGVYLAYGCAEGLLQRFLAVEVAATRVPEELFRVNSPTTRLMGLLFRTLGQDYLASVVRPAIADASEDLPDTTRGKEEKDEEEEDEEEEVRERAVVLCQRLLADRVYGSCERVPRLLRELLHDVRATVALRFPQQARLSVGAFFVLRYLVPALVAPAGAGVAAADPPPRVLRRLRAVSGVLQKLANGVAPGARPAEQAFFARNHPLVLELFDTLAAVAPAPAPRAPRARPAVCVDAQLATLAALAARHFPAIAAHARAHAPAIDVPRLAAALGVSRRHAASVRGPLPSATSTTPACGSTVAITSATAAIAAPVVVLGKAAKCEQQQQQHQAQPQAQPQAQHYEFVEDALDDVDAALAELGARAAALGAGTRGALAEERAAHRRAALANLVLRAEISALCRRYGTAPAPAVAPLLLPVRDDGGEGEGGGSLAEQQRQDLLAQAWHAGAPPAPSAAAAAHVRQWRSVRPALDELRALLAAADDPARTVRLARTVSELHSHMQAPLERRLELPPAPATTLPATAATAPALTPERVAPLRTAALHALDEIQHTVDALVADAVPLAPLFDVQQRLDDIFALLDEVSSNSVK